MQRFSFANIEHFSTASLITRLTNDVSSVQMTLMMGMRMLVRAPVMLITALVMALTISLQLSQVFLVVLPLLFVWLSAEFGLLMDLKRPNLVWTNEITVIKQRITVLLVMLAGWLYAAAIAALYFVVGADMGAAWYLLAWSVLTAALAVLLRRWLRRSGSRLLGRLA